MDKKELKTRLEEVKKQLVANAKDSHFTEKLLNDILSLKGQLSVEPIDFDLGKKVDDFKGEYFEIVKTTKGVLFRTYGGLLTFAKPNLTALYEMLVHYVDNKDEYEKLSEEDKEIYELQLSCISYIVTLPMYAFSDASFTLDMANRIIGYLNDSAEKLMNEPLQEETPEKDEEFKEAALGLEKIKEAIS